MDTNSNSIPVLIIGLNHKVAPVAIRERLAFGPERVRSVLRQLIGSETSGIREAVLLSTCNRSEIYVCACELTQAERCLRAFLLESVGLPEGQLRGMLYELRGEAAVKHLMQVAAGLDSLVLGENEILGQVRNAAELAHAARATGPVLSALFRYAVGAGKRARAETEIGKGEISVASVVVELADRSLGPLAHRTALLVGAGKISAITARALVEAGLRCVMVANRTFEQAQKLARSLPGEAVHFDALEDNLVQADIVICSTGAPHFVLHADQVARVQGLRQGCPLLVVDLAVPRDADPAIGSIPGVKLANIDDLEVIVKNSHPLTASVCREVEAIVEQELGGFIQWFGARRCAPVIKALYNKAETIYQAEVKQTLQRLGPLTPHQERLVAAMGKSIAGKLLHEPVIQLRELAPDEDLSAYLELVQALYGIQ